LIQIKSRVFCIIDAARDVGRSRSVQTPAAGTFSPINELIARPAPVTGGGKFFFTPQRTPSLLP
jgi:hypothetical protein